MSEVRRVGQEQLGPVAHTIAASFADDPIWRWLYGTAGKIPIDDGMVLARMLVAQSTPHDTIHTISDCGAVALWTAPRGPKTDNAAPVAAEVAAYQMAFASQLGDRVALAASLSAAIKEHRPAEPHWYLGILGADPDRQNQGLGGKVLSAMLQRTDRLGLSTYLESSNPRNYGFYQRHGFVEAGELIVEDSPPLLGFHRVPSEVSDS